MPMLTTLRMRLPVWPCHAPLRTRPAKAAIASRTAWTSGTTFGPVDDDGLSARRAQRDMEDGAVLGDVDLLAAEHRVDAIAQPGLLRQLPQQTERLVGDAVLGVVETEAGEFHRHSLAALRVVREERTQVQAADLLVVRLQRLPRWARRQHGHLAWWRLSLLDAITSMRLAPGIDERLGAFLLELRRESGNVDTGVRETLAGPRQNHRRRRACSDAYLPCRRQRLERALRYGVDRERRRKRVDVETSEA